MNTTTTAPAGFTPNYFENEFDKKPVRDLVDYSGPEIERPGYKIQSTWMPETGLRLFIDHSVDDPYTVEEIRDLIATLSQALEDMGAGA